MTAKATKGMPNRILREGILTSPRVNCLDWMAELFYRRLLSVVDDYGRYYAHPVLLRAACFPINVDKVREADMSRWIAQCEKARLIRLYCEQEDGVHHLSANTHYLEVLDFRQQVRSKSKFPDPPHNLPSDCAASAAHDDAHLRSRLLTGQQGDGSGPSNIPSSSLGLGSSDSKRNCSPREEDRKVEGARKKALWGYPPVQFDSERKCFVGIGESDLELWSEAYPAVDVKRQLVEMVAWITANPRKGRKSNYAKFVNSWLAREQDRGGELRGKPTKVKVPQLRPENVLP